MPVGQRTVGKFCIAATTWPVFSTWDSTLYRTLFRDQLFISWYREDSVPITRGLAVADRAYCSALSDHLHVTNVCVQDHPRPTPQTVRESRE
ncbi:uncharacterized protein EKO05_0009073 [Ascochyta rabiei]|uniref:uncharacterized protein n=1 Tax=Didymella rabiei TaxID=5454 RepID=UPI0022098023|nr:uncharacterized protein EKO05_0009073 [Ascochyta rabiei]UPX18781.1 hypothetical protein EKO05_0009073 [Ascochyta rabiei]